MSEAPKPHVVGFATFAFVEELTETLVAKGILSDDDIRNIFSSGAHRLDKVGFIESKQAAAFLRSRIIAKE